MSLWKYLGFDDSSEQSTKGSLFSALEGLLLGFDERQQQLLTGVAGLLGAIAFDDLEISEGEQDFLKRKFSELCPTLREADSRKIVEIVVQLTEKLSGIEDYRYARMLNQVCTREEKRDILAALFEIAALDHSISAEEEQRVRNIAKELKLMPADFLTARSSQLEHVEALKLVLALRDPS